MLDDSAQVIDSDGQDRSTAADTRHPTSATVRHLLRSYIHRVRWRAKQFVAFVTGRRSLNLAICGL